MNKIPVLFFLFVLLLGCNYEKYRYSFFEGNWVLLNYLDSAQKYRSLQHNQQQPMVEIILKRHIDSITFVYNNLERISYPYEAITSNSIRIPHFEKEQPLTLFMNEYAYYLSYDKDSIRYVFVRPDDRLIDSTSNTSTLRVVHSLVLGGIYKMEGREIPVQFYTDGSITGLPNYQYYEVCTGGDCQSFYEGDIFSISKNGQADWYTWEWEGKNLRIYSLKRTNPVSEKPVYTKGALFITLTKIK